MIIPCRALLFYEKSKDKTAHSTILAQQGAGIVARIRKNKTQYLKTCLREFSLQIILV